jgi:nuclear transport factor 2 (NTF2) superfamily protein
MFYLRPKVGGWRKRAKLKKYIRAISPVLESKISKEVAYKQFKELMIYGSSAVKITSDGVENVYLGKTR